MNVKKKENLKQLNNMETIQVKKSFILEAHAAACQDLKSKIEKELPELFKMKFKDGDWVTNDEIGWLHKIGYDASGDKSDSFNLSLDYYNDPNAKSTVKKYRLATSSEIEKHLIALAEKKGFKEGVIIERSHLADNTVSVIIKSVNCGDPNWAYDSSQDRLRIMGNTIYVNGKWAEIIEEPFVFTGKIMTAEIEGKKFQVKIIEEVK